LLTTDVLGQHNGPTFIALPEASVTANLGSVASQEGEDIIRSSFFVMDFMLPTCRPKFPEISCKTYKVDQAWSRVRHWRLIASTFACKNPQNENLHSFNVPVEILCLCLQNTNKKQFYCYNTQISLPTNLILVRVSGDWLWFILFCDHNWQLHWVYTVGSRHVLEALVAVQQRSQVWDFNRK